MEKLCANIGFLKITIYILEINTERNDGETGYTLPNDRCGLVMSAESIVEYHAKRVWQKNRGFDLDDIMQEARMGAIRAAIKFDPDKSSSFNTYVSYWVINMISRWIRSNLSVLTVPDHLMARAGIYRREVFKEESPSVDELIEMFGVSKVTAEKVKQIIDNVGFETSIDAPIKLDENMSLKDVIGEDCVVLDKTEEVRDRGRLLNLIREKYFTNYKKKFLERDWDIFINRFGFNEDQEVLTLELLSEKHGLSRQGVQYIEKKILAKISSDSEIVEMLKDLVGH
ncbi:sigma-70 family RNA polymerase sigma factor [Candidatus Peregrinibacteria bacterium]|nr:sigma-70 family RNA polymerase sigma factor [Candidatus Peregrinibacteria bacterium]